MSTPQSIDFIRNAFLDLVADADQFEPNGDYGYDCKISDATLRILTEAIGISVRQDETALDAINREIEAENAEADDAEHPEVESD